MDIGADAWAITVVRELTCIVASIVDMRDWVDAAETEALSVGSESGAGGGDFEFSGTADEREDGVDTHICSGGGF